MNIQIINPIEYPGWDDLLLTNDRSTFFHTTAWAKVLSESYNYKPLYFTVIEDGKLSSLIPVMEVNSFLTGKKGISLPFTDYCPLITDNQHHLNFLTEQLFQYGKKSGWQYVELRGGTEYDNTVAQASVAFIAHSLDLSQGEQDLFRNLGNSTRRNIKRAIKEKIQVIFENTRESVEIFFDLNCITRKRHGLPPQPFFFSKKFLSISFPKTKELWH